MKDFRGLQIWQRSHALTLKVYRSTMNFPKEELYGLVSRMRRAASSVPTNIAEGCGRSGDADFARLLQIAMGSASELEYQLILAHDLTFLPDEAHNELTSELSEIKRMLNAFLTTLRSKPKDPSAKS